MNDSSMNEQSLPEIVDNFLQNVVYTAVQQTGIDVPPPQIPPPQLNLPISIHEPINNALEQSFYEDTSVSKIASAKGKEIVTTIVYDASSNLTNTQCPITLCDFKQGESISKMPCGHVFNKAALEMWFQNSNKCPICRYELDYIEKSNHPNDVVPTLPATFINSDDDGYDEEDDGMDLNPGFGPPTIENINTHMGSFAGFFNNFIQRQMIMEEQALLQEALYNSMLFQQDIADDDDVSGE